MLDSILILGETYRWSPQAVLSLPITLYLDLLTRHNTKAAVQDPGHPTTPGTVLPDGTRIAHGGFTRPPRKPAPRASS